MRSLFFESPAMTTSRLRRAGRALFALLAALPLSVLSPSAQAEAGATRPPSKSVRTAVVAAPTEPLDVDGNGVIDPLTDGLLVMRYAMGLRGPVLIEGAIGANATRTTAEAIETHLGSLVRAIPGDCVVTAAPETSIYFPLPPGNTVELTAHCARGSAPIEFAWSVGVTDSSILLAPAQTTTFLVTPTNAAGKGAGFFKTVHVAPSADAPYGCSVAQVPDTAVSFVVPGTTIVLTVNCQGGMAPTSCAWSPGIASTACAIAITLPAVTTTYHVTATNAYGASPELSATLSVATPVEPPQCAAADLRQSLPWPATGFMRVSSTGFDAQRLSFAITIPLTFSPALNVNHLGFIAITEMPGSSPTDREVTVSKYPCDFQSTTYLDSNIGLGQQYFTTTFTANNPTGYAALGGEFNVNPGEVVYVNVRNRNAVGPSCVAGPCDIFLDFATPNRY